MQETFGKVFVFLSKQLLISLLIFLGVVFIFIKSYERFLSKKISNRFKFLQNREKEIPFEIFLAGALFLATSLLIKLRYAVPFIWLLVSSSLFIGGLFGLIPFSFIEEKSKIRRKMASLNQTDLMSMGIGALLLSIAAFLCGFLYIFRNNPKDIPIAIIMGIVFIPGGVLLGIFLGMIVSYIKKKKKS